MRDLDEYSRFESKRCHPQSSPRMTTLSSLWRLSALILHLQPLCCYYYFVAVAVVDVLLFVVVALLGAGLGTLTVLSGTMRVVGP